MPATPWRWTRQNANDSLPSPDAALTQRLALAYQLDYEAGTACYSNQSAGTMRKVTAQRERADRLLSEATATVGQLAGIVVSTTTTLTPTTLGGGF